MSARCARRAGFVRFLARFSQKSLYSFAKSADTRSMTTIETKDQNTGSRIVWNVHYCSPIKVGSSNPNGYTHFLGVQRAIRGRRAYAMWAKLDEAGNVLATSSPWPAL